METLTADQFKKRYGVMAESQFDLAQKNQDKEASIFNEIKDAFTQGVNKVGQGIQEAKPVGGEGVGGLVTGVGKILGGASEAITSPVAPLLSRTLGKAVNYVGDKISNIPAVQKFAQSPAGQATSKVAETVGNYANAAGLVVGARTGASAATKVPGLASEAATAVGEAIPKPSLGKTGTSAVNAVKDVIPTTQNLIDHNLARALDLTPGDLSNISKSTGNEVGRWMADNNLIGTNKANTLGLIKSFFTDNYNNVRSEIGKVKDVYDANTVPYYKDTLNALATETQGKLGLEGTTSEITKLLKKEQIILSDIQRVKELLDEHYSLYKVTGDVQSGVAKQGLANVREQIKGFIENEVQQKTGADIRQMNNNVATAKSLADAITTRSPRGLTRAQLTWRDAAIGMGLTYFGSPLLGLAAVATWKIITSPSMRLRFSRFLDGLNDAQKAKVSEAIRDNKLTPEIKKVLDLKEGDSISEDASDLQSALIPSKPETTPAK